MWAAHLLPGEAAQVVGAWNGVQTSGKVLSQSVGFGQGARASTTGGSRTTLSSSYTLRFPVLDPCG